MLSSCSGIVADALGRRRAILLLAAIFSVGAALQLLAVRHGRCTTFRQPTIPVTGLGTNKACFSLTWLAPT